MHFEWPRQLIDYQYCWQLIIFQSFHFNSNWFNLKIEHYLIIYQRTIYQRTHKQHSYYSWAKWFIYIIHFYHFQYFHYFLKPKFKAERKWFSGISKMGMELNSVALLSCPLVAQHETTEKVKLALSSAWREHSGQVAFFASVKQKLQNITIT